MRALDVLAGLIVGGIVWAILSFILSFIPIIGWIIAAIVGGYVAGIIGGGAAAVILALFSPILVAILAGILISFIPFGFLQTFFGAIAGIIIALWAIINLIFVGIGGYIGSKSYKSETCPYCGAKIRKGVLVCSSCGRELKAGVRPSRVEIISEKKPSFEEEKEKFKGITLTRECPFCGEQIPINIEICPICKNKLPK